MVQYICFAAYDIVVYCSATFTVGRKPGYYIIAQRLRKRERGFNLWWKISNAISPLCRAILLVVIVLIVSHIPRTGRCMLRESLVQLYYRPIGLGLDLSDSSSRIEVLSQQQQSAAT